MTVMSISRSVCGPCFYFHFTRYAISVDVYIPSFLFARSMTSWIPCANISGRSTGAIWPKFLTKITFEREEYLASVHGISPTNDFPFVRAETPRIKAIMGIRRSQFQLLLLSLTALHSVRMTKLRLAQLTDTRITKIEHRALDAFKANNTNFYYEDRAIR